MGSDGDPTRRQVLATCVAGATAIAVPGLAAAAARSAGAKMKASSDRMPVVYLPHGGGPWPFVDVGFGDKAELSELALYLKSIATVPKKPPKAVLIVSAHWEESAPTVMTSAHPPMLYDYYGFPPDSYTITWPASGDKQVADRVQGLLRGAGFQTAANPDRGFDHGTFVPLKLAYPKADVPTVQLSLKTGLDPAEHLAMGRALGPLRDEGVYIVGSGMTFHNLRAFGAPHSKPVSEDFDRWLRETVPLDAKARDQRLTEWLKAPAARAAHPREEHLIPLMVCAGAAGEDRGHVAYNGTLVGLRISAHHFG